jgi:hypothetical protein
MSTIEALVVAGGGSGGNGGAAGGGGAGGYQYNSSLTVTPQTFIVTVGAGGIAQGEVVAQNSVFSTITAIGGGKGGANGNGANGGCGGGSSFTGTGGIGSQGNNGGSGSGTGAGGGGGAGANGANGSGSNAGVGGVGVVNPITGSTIGQNVGGTYYICGGGGGGGTNPAVGGQGGGGNGGATPTVGTANTGGGGGGQKSSLNGANGGSGVVVLRWLTSDFEYSSITGIGNVITTNGSYSIASLIVSGTITLANKPTVTTQTVSSIAKTTATGNGNVTSDNGATITERGVCWKTSSGPTTADSKTTSSGTTGAFTASMTGLASNTTYYARAYAINSIGTSYGGEVTFTTLSSGDFFLII